MPVSTRTLLFLFATFSLVVCSSVQADTTQYRKIGADGGVVVEVRNNYQCQGPAPVRVRAPSADWFDAQTSQFQRLLGMARIALSFECPDIQAIEVTGVAQKTQAYQGHANKAGDWIIKKINVKAPEPSASPLHAVNQVAEKPKVPNHGALGGLWFGNASCGRGRSHRTKPAEVVIIQQENGSYKGVATITERNGKHTVMPFTATKGKIRHGMQSYNARGKKGNAQVTSIARVDLLDDAPRHIAIRVSGKCKFISAARLIKIGELGGEYAHWNSPESMCKGFNDWVRTAQTEQKIVDGWKKKYPDYLGNNDLKTGINSSLFDDEVFRQRFGLSVDQLSAKTYAQLVTQVGECAHFKLWTDKPLRKDIEATLVGPGGYRHLSKMLVPNETRIRDYHADKLTLKPSLAEIQAQAAQNKRQLAKLPETIQTVSQAITLAGLKSQTQETLKKLSHLPPSQLTSIIESANKQRDILQSGVEANKASPTEKLLARRTTPFFTSDALKGHTLLSAVFGHSLYVSNAIATSGKCPRVVPVRVQLGSLLPLKHYEKRKYGKQFFFYGLKALDSICEWPSDDQRGAGWKIRVHYHFDGEEVGQLTIDQRNYSIYPSEAEMKLNGWARNPEHPNYAYDVAFATMVGGISDRHGQPIRKLTQQDLDKLSGAGDLHAALHMAFNDVGIAAIPETASANQRKILRQALRGTGYDTGTANADLSLDLSSPPRNASLVLLQKASAQGSVAASHLLALDLGLKSGLMRSISGAKDKPFDQLGKQEQDNFVLWAAKARLGRVYWSVFLNEAIQGWNIDMQAGNDAIAKDGFAAKSLYLKPNTQTAANTEMAEIIAAARQGKATENVATSAPTKPVAPLQAGQKLSAPKPGQEKSDWVQTALIDYHLHDCRRAANMLSEYSTALDGKWTVQDRSCVFENTSKALSLRVGKIVDQQCSGGDDEKTCDIAYQVICETNSATTKTATGSQTTDKSLSPVCKDINAFPISVFVTFKRKSANRWNVDGDILKM